MKERVRSERLESQPLWQLLLARLVDELDAANLGATLHPARHVVLRQLAFDALLQSIGRSRIEALADQRIEVVAQRLCQLFIGYPADVGLLDDVARVDVVVAIGHFLAADDEEHARLPVGIHDGAHGGDVSWSLAFDAGGKCVEARLCESGAGEVANLLAKAGTQAIDVESGHLRRDDDRAFRDDGLADRSRPGRWRRGG